LGFSFSGKKVIKSIQDRILKLKGMLRDVIKQNNPKSSSSVPIQIMSDPEKSMKFYLN